MLETFTIATFAPHLGDRFALHLEEAPAFDLALIDATALGDGDASGTTPGGRRVPFSLIFRGPADRVLPQRIYRLEHEAIGGFELFLVPIGPDGQGMRYEAIFT